jgi:hypothetical protein
MLKQQNPLVLGTSPVSFNSHLSIDSKGRCHHHPHITLRKKSMMRGWKVVLPTCPACDLDRKMSKRRASSASDHRGKKTAAKEEQKHDYLRSSKGSSMAKKQTMSSAPPSNLTGDAVIGQASAKMKMLKQQAVPTPSRDDESLPQREQSNILSERKASTNNTSKQRSDSHMIVNTSYSRHASDPFPISTTATIITRSHISKSRTKRSSEAQKSDPDGIKANATTFRRSTSTPIGGKSINSRIESYRASVVASLQSSDPDGMSWRNITSISSATDSSLVQRFPENASFSSDSDQYVSGPNKKSGSKQRLECLSPARSNHEETTSNLDNSYCASAASFQSKDFDELSTPGNILERMVNYVRHSSAPATMSSQGVNAKTKRHTSFDSRKSQKSTDPEGKIASPVRRSTKKTHMPLHHRRHTTTGCSFNINSANDNSLNQSGFVISETNVAKDFTNSKSSLDFNVDNLRQSNASSTRATTIDMEYSENSSCILPVVYEDDTRGELSPQKSAPGCYHRGQSSLVHHSTSRSTTNKTPPPPLAKESNCDEVSSTTLQSESYPCIFIPNLQDATETESTCSSFTESHAGHSLFGGSAAPSSKNNGLGVSNRSNSEAPSSKNNGLGASYKSVIFACGMPHVLSASRGIQGDYTGQVAASTKQPHGLGAFVQSNGEKMEGIWRDGVLVTPFEGKDCSPSESARFCSNKTPIIRNKSNMSIDQMGAVPLPLPVVKSSTPVVDLDQMVGESLDAVPQSK